MVTTELFGRDEQQLRARVLKLERRVQLLLGIVRLLFVLVRLFSFRLDSQRVPSGESKPSILGAIERAKKRVPLAVALRVLGLSASRYHAWLRLEQSCSLDDRSSCPRTIPSQLTRQGYRFDEVAEQRGTRGCGAPERSQNESPRPGSAGVAARCKVGQ